MFLIKNPELHGWKIYKLPWRIINFFEKISLSFRNKYIIPKRIKMNMNHSFSIFSNDCIGAFIYHDLQEQFRTPTVALYIPPTNFIKMMKNAKYYLEQNIIKIEDDTLKCPAGILGNEIKIYFIHYDSFEDALECWNRRIKRINWDDIYVILYDRNDNGEYTNKGYLPKDVYLDFEKIPYENKFFITKDSRKKKWKDVLYLKKYRKVVGFILPVKIELFGGKRIFERCFNIIKILNKGRHESSATFKN